MENRLHFNINSSLSKEKSKVFEAVLKEQKSRGYYNLPNKNVDYILDFDKELNSSIESIVVLGIGGSSLGAKAIYNFLKPVKNFKRDIFFFETTDPLNISKLEKKINFKKAHFLVVSKSGTTLETVALFKYFYNKYGENKRFSFITENGSPLAKLGKDLNCKIFEIPKNVAGRFSVLSNAGLVPLALIGVNIKALLNGAKFTQNSFFNEGYLKNILLEKALFFAKNHQTYNINVLFAYSGCFKHFVQWYIQLWGESLGKKQEMSIFNVGITPIGLIGPEDQHSFLQPIIEGTRNKTVTFLKIRNFHRDLVVPDISFNHLKDLDYINGLEFNDLIDYQCEATKNALLSQGDIPIDEIIIDDVSEESIGKLIYYFELLTSLVGILINVNSYNQPGVELGKKFLKEKLKEVKG